MISFFKPRKKYVEKLDSKISLKIILTQEMANIVRKEHKILFQDGFLDAVMGLHRRLQCADTLDEEQAWYDLGYNRGRIALIK